MGPQIAMVPKNQSTVAYEEAAAVHRAVLAQGAVNSGPIRLCQIGQSKGLRLLRLRDLVQTAGGIRDALRLRSSTASGENGSAVSLTFELSKVGVAPAQHRLGFGKCRGRRPWAQGHAQGS